MLSLILDLARQVRGVLRPAHGGLGNARGWATGTLLPMSNRTGVDLPLMTLVRAVAAGGHRVEPTDTDAETDVLGVVVGYVAPDGLLTEADAPDGATVAVLVDGVTSVLIDVNVERGDYAFASVTAGAARPDATAGAGVFGQFVASGGAGQYALVRIMPSSASSGGGAPATADYLVGTSQPGLSAEIVVGATPGGELGGTWASPTVDTTHSGSSHASKAPVGADYLVGTANADLTSEIVVGTTPGGELGNTWASPTVDATHSGSTHAATAASAVTTAEAYSDAADATHAALPNVHHARQHSAVSTSDHTFPGGTSTFLRADGSWASPAASGAGGSAKGWVGDGSDGNIVLDGTNTYSFLTKTGNVYQQNRDIFANNLTIDAGKTLQTSQFRTYVLGTLTVNGTLTAAGTDAGGISAATAGQAPATIGSPTLGGGQDGGAGRTNSAGVGTTTANAPTSTAGGRGGSGGSATSAGGGAGTVGPTAGGTNWRSLPWAVMGTMSPTTAVSGFTLLKGGTGGGSGASNSSTTTVSGGGGGGAGVLIVCATTIIVGAAGVITAAGGNGATATGTGAAGGGGGGGGGAMVLLYEALTNSGSITVAGGIHGNGINGGNNGVDGSAGVILQFAMA